MKKCIYIITMAVLTIQFLSCSKSDDENVQQQQFSVMSRSLPGETEIPTGAIGGTDVKPVEGPMFYYETPNEVVAVVALGDCYTIDENDSVFLSKDIGGGVLTQCGGSFIVTNEGEGLHIVGSGVEAEVAGITYYTTLSLDIDDVNLIESGNATITNFDLSETIEIEHFKDPDYTHLSASDIPMVGGLPRTRWEGGTITDYSWTSRYSRLSLIDNPANYLEVWVHFKEGFSVKARIGR